MPKCPYCDAELEISLSIKPVPIEDKFRKEVMTALEGYFDIMLDAAPFGKMMLRTMRKRVVKWQQKFIDGIAALPIIIQSCKNCDAVIGTAPLIDIGSVGSFGGTSS
ncbi:MAG: hypothetical protein EU547_02720 [Promethearchaeota archaeon]|nr:MAG: hypothetical protein EU547_02720 [Candidatus Lokiarchaeota archaeon]